MILAYLVHLHCDLIICLFLCATEVGLENSNAIRVPFKQCFLLCVHLCARATGCVGSVTSDKFVFLTISASLVLLMSW